MTGALSVNEAEETWSLDEGVILKRYPSYSDELIDIPAGKTLTLENITVDGAKEMGVEKSDSLINIQSSGKLIVEKGTVLQNNNKSYGKYANDYLAGGAVYINSGAAMTMKGGTIKNNSAYFGGGVFLRGTFEMDAGTI